MIELPYEEKDDVAIMNEGYWIETGWNEWEYDKWDEYDDDGWGWEII